MNSIVPTPLTQALQEGALTRRELKLLMRRSDKPAFLRLLLWALLLSITTTIVWASIGQWYVIPAMFVHGIVLVHHFSLQHECCHYTAFKTRWLNDWVGNFCGLVIMLPNRFFRYEHCDHHTYTQVVGKDTEMIDLPKSLLDYFLYISSYPYWKSKFSELWRHSMGIVTPSDKVFIPREERKTVIWEARLMVMLYTVIIITALVFHVWEVLWLWFLPIVLGEPVMRAIRMTEHVGRPTVKDMRTNTRSNRVALPWRFLCWNMNYHAEHHYASSVPFHALPILSAKLEGYIYTEKRGYIGAHVDIISQLLRKTPSSNNS